jgi:transcription antitermination factor NusG
MELSTEAAWYVIHTRPKCEHLAAAMMQGLPGVEAYCPRIKFQRSTRRGKVWFIEALFPSYFFARFVPAISTRAVRHSQNVLRIVGFGDTMSPVPDGVIRAIRQEMNDQALKEVQIDVKVGDVVELTEGPMRGLKGIVNCVLSGEERVKILLEFLGRESLVEVKTTQILTEQMPRAVVAGRERRS